MQNLKSLSLIVALAALPSLAFASGDAARAPVAVSFAATLETRIAASYGESERETLRTFVVESVDRAVARRADRAAIPAGVRVEVVLADALPSHPTRRQGLENPSVDTLRSRSLGGADLTGTVRGADGQVLATLSYAYYAPDLATASPGGDTWADARVAIDRFAGQLAARLGASR